MGSDVGCSVKWTPHLSAALALIYLFIYLKNPFGPFNILGGQGQERETVGAVLDGAGGPRF